MANVLFIKGNTATINSTAIADGQLLWNTVTGEIWEDVGTSRIACGKLVDTSLNPTSPNAVSNQAITGSIVNLLSTAIGTTEDYIPCGTKPVKELYEARNGVVLWTNSSPTSSFAGQKVTLSETIENYNYYEVVFLVATNEPRINRTGKILKTYSTRLQSSSTNIRYRNVEVPSGTSLQFGVGNLIATYGTTSTDNTMIIPLEIIGYK